MTEGEHTPQSTAQVWLDPGDESGVRWVGLASGSDPESVLEELDGEFVGLTVEMLEDLLRPDVGEPYGERWNHGETRLVSTFGVYPGTSEPRSRKRRSKATATLEYQPVELLASRSWLLSCWHPVETYHGSKRLEVAEPPRDCQEVVDAVLKRWGASGGRGAGDLGVLVMQELALTYAPAHRLLYAELEEQEFSLYDYNAEDPDDARRTIQDVSQGLSDVWGARAVFYDRLTPLNIPGLKDNYEDRAWLPASGHSEGERVDDQIDRSLKNLRKLSDSLRTSFHNLQLLNADAHRDHREQRQRHIEILAAVFLIPTLIVGFYGANTWIPGEHQEWGFIVMVACIAILTGFATLWIRRMQEGDDVRGSKLLRNPFRDRGASD